MGKKVTTKEMVGIVAKNLCPHSNFDLQYFLCRTKRQYSLEFSVCFLKQF